MPSSTFGFGNAAHGVAKFFSDELSGIGVDRIGDLRHVTLLHQDADHVDRAFGHAIGQFLDGDGLRDRHFTGDLSFGSLSRWPEMRWTRRRNEATERSWTSSAERAVTTVSRPRRFSAPTRGVFGGGAGRTGAPPGPRRMVRGASSSSASSTGRAPGFAGHWLGAEAFLGDLVGLAFGFFVVLAALFFVTFARFRFGAVRLVGFFAALPNARFFLGDLALFGFTQARVGERVSPRVSFLVRECAQHDSGRLQSSAGNGGAQQQAPPAPWRL